MKEKTIPLAYIITCRTYATWLHGDCRTSVDRMHNVYAMPRLKPNSVRQTAMQKACSETAFLINAPQRETALQSVIDTCRHANWYLHAAHIRTNHMHAVITGEKEPEKIVTSLKAYATRYLKRDYPELHNRQRFWAKGASTRYLFESLHVMRAIQYTVEEQGEKMACYCDPEYRAISLW